MKSVLSRNFYKRKTDIVAKDLLGKIILRKLPQEIYLTGIIVETEAYFGEGDIASHARRGKTSRCEVMFGKPGISYVYFTYGMHYMLNIVIGKKGTAGAVLIRAVEPVKGIEMMKTHRKTSKVELLTNGPAKFTKAFQINLKDNKRDVTSGNIIIKNNSLKSIYIKSSHRIGVPLDNNDHFRYYISGNRYVSRILKKGD
ncbi:MAG: DNA-3-methyladenine glycosylase [Actinomycetia bacterium]|nr:DNA-3-methyladenine glycosylase [Actinomycetes bacterium]